MIYFVYFDLSFSLFLLFYFLWFIYFLIRISVVFIIINKKKCDLKLCVFLDGDNDVMNL